jgi:hypothetical protein
MSELNFLEDYLKFNDKGQMNQLSSKLVTDLVVAVKYISDEWETNDFNQGSQEEESKGL